MRRTGNTRLSPDLKLAALEASANAMLITDRSGTIVWTNPAFSRLSGYSKEETIGRTPNIQKSGEHKDAFFSKMWNTILTGEVWCGETYNKRKDGTIYVEEQTITPIRGADGEIEHFISVKQDITRRKLDEEALKQSHQDLSAAKYHAEKQAAFLTAQTEELTRMRNEALAAAQTKSLFLANISHELRTPLTAIIGFAEEMLAEGLSPRDQEKALQIIGRNGRHLLQLINDILDISKIEAEKLAVENIECSPFQILSDIQTTLLPKALQKQLSLTVEYLYPLPKLIKSDPTRLKQILFNLISNAIKFTEEGWVKVALSADINNRKINFSVRDSGIGITKEDQARLFTPFVQADGSINRKFGGTGLGLAISKELCRRLGGELHVKSSPGKGSIFSFSVDSGEIEAEDLLESQPALINFESSAIPQVLSKPAGLKGNILLADDMADNQALISFIIRKLGGSVSVKCVENGKAAVEEALSKNFDLVLMDMHMPVMDGFHAVQTLRENGYNKPVVALTADTSDKSASKCFDAGCDDYLTKPFERKNLYSILSKYLPQEEMPAQIVHAERLEQNADLAAIVLSFVSSLPRRIRELDAALRDGNWNEIRALTHKLQSAGLFGYPTLSESAAVLHKTAVNQDPAEAQSSFDNLKELTERIVAGRDRLSQLIANKGD